MRGKRGTFKVQATDAEVQEFFDRFDIDPGGKRGGRLSLSGLKECLLALNRAYYGMYYGSDKKGRLNQKLARAQSESHVRFAALLQEASEAMVDVEENEGALVQYENSLSFEARAGLGLVHTGHSLTRIIQDWPGATVGYATLLSFMSGIDALHVPGGYRRNELIDFYFEAFMFGLDHSMCRPGGGLQLSYALSDMMRKGREALKEQQGRQGATDEMVQRAGRLQMACAVLEAERTQAVQAALEARAAAAKEKDSKDKGGKERDRAACKQPDDARAGDAKVSAPKDAGKRPAVSPASASFRKK